MTGGHILDMISRLRYNEALRGRVSFRQLRKSYLKVLKSEGFESAALTEAQILAIRERIRLEEKRQKRKAIFTFIFSVLTTAILIYIVIYLLSFYL